MQIRKQLAQIADAAKKAAPTAYSAQPATIDQGIEARMAARAEINYRVDRRQRASRNE